MSSEADRCSLPLCPARHSRAPTATARRPRAEAGGAGEAWREPRRGCLAASRPAGSSGGLGSGARRARLWLAEAGSDRGRLRAGPEFEEAKAGLLWVLPRSGAWGPGSEVSWTLRRGLREGELQGSLSEGVSRSALQWGWGEKL